MLSLPCLWCWLVAFVRVLLLCYGTSKLNEI